MIITIDMEFASKGNKIGELVAKKLGIRYYDRETLEEEAKNAGMFEELKDFCKEELVNSLLYVIATNNYNNKHGKIPFEFIRRLAAKESGVLMGRCGNYIFRDEPDATSVFIHAPKEIRVARVMERNGLSKSKSERYLEKEDKIREGFHTYYTDEKWNVAAGYHLCIDSSTLDEETAADFIIEFAEKRKNQENGKG